MPKGKPAPRLPRCTILPSKIVMLPRRNTGGVALTQLSEADLPDAGAAGVRRRTFAGGRGSAEARLRQREGQLE